MQLYLGYKYYFKAMVEDEAGSGIKAALLKSQLQLDIPADFQISNTYTLHAGGDLIPYTAITPDSCKNLWNHVGDFFFGADPPGNHKGQEQDAADQTQYDVQYNHGSIGLRL